MSIDKNLKSALKNLLHLGVDAKIIRDNLYITISDMDFELSQFEIDFQADEWNEKQKDEQNEVEE